MEPGEWRKVGYPEEGGQGVVTHSSGREWRVLGVKGLRRRGSVFEAILLQVSGASERYPALAALPARFQLQWPSPRAQLGSLPLETLTSSSGKGLKAVSPSLALFPVNDDPGPSKHAT